MVTAAAIQNHRVPFAARIRSSLSIAHNTSRPHSALGYIPPRRSLIATRDNSVASEEAIIVWGQVIRAQVIGTMGGSGSDSLLLYRALWAAQRGSRNPTRG